MCPGFTLIELMVAVGLMAVFMSIAIPTLYRNMSQDSMRKAMNDVMEACSLARARAILDNTTMELRIRPGEGTLSIGSVSGPAAGGPGGMPGPGFEGDPTGGQFGGPRGGLPDRVDYQWGDRMVQRPTSSGPANFSVKLGPSIIIEGLGVNGDDWTTDPEARVRFYPNGTSDEMSMVLLSNKGERRNIWLEVVTGFAQFEVDPFKFRDR